MNFDKRMRHCPYSIASFTSSIVKIHYCLRHVGSRISILQGDDLALLAASDVILELGDDLQIVLHHHVVIETLAGVGANLLAQPGILLNCSLDDL